MPKKEKKKQEDNDQQPEESQDIGGALSFELDQGTSRLLQEQDIEDNLKTLERHPAETKVAKESVILPKETMRELMNEADDDINLKDLERK